MGSEALHFKSPSAVKSPPQNACPGAPKKPATPATLRLRHVMSARREKTYVSVRPIPRRHPCIGCSQHAPTGAERARDSARSPSLARGLGLRRDAGSWSPAKMQFAQQNGHSAASIDDPREQPRQ
ncbi:hypothetical protein M441DRAFT_43755 [Trichoderma asperellum CBS 433.97]|uniref:Uncharacterized protein n=1 Tax=Trichoderma asperellum (strain ATCC 204424 / CBS 433.97 / NBRC 101777) TaxID=1042311 RepID=A0A2T3ZLS1_TRIA4|nr:hypothetical protein M441DRAFT_43755 [Trichoderma asperellum CBS 433.97]PTB45754.1 hypothetical protein M441DRAFT_43755 [Trichoderma asperellum CBS 433.97]